MSPIKGLTDREMRFPEIGQIRKGGKKTATAPGRDLNYFRVEFDSRETNSMETFTKMYGPEPRDINIVLPFNEIERVWDAWLEGYNKGRMIARSDGEKYLYRIAKTGEVMVQNGEPYMAFDKEDVLDTWLDSKGKVNDIKCRPVGRLKVVLPELQRLAYLTVLTTSYHDIINIQGQLEAIKAINGGKLGGIPLVLRRRPKMISTPKPDGSSARYEKWMLSIEADPEFVKRMLSTLKVAALPGNGLALLPESVTPINVISPNVPQSFAEESDDEEEENNPLDGEWSDPEEQQAPPPAPEKPVRPLSPETLKDFLEKKAAGYASRPLPNEKQLGLVLGMANVCFAGDPDSETKRHDALNYLTGEGHTSKIPGPMIYALLDWFKPVKDSGDAYVPDAMAVKEMHAVWTESQKAAGQQELPI
jgi:hypothetical protein